jgi:tetratricopeptide (TPR) repeat protein
MRPESGILAPMRSTPFATSVAAALAAVLVSTGLVGPSAAATAPATGPSTRPAMSPAGDRSAAVIRFLEQRVGRDPDDITAQNRLAGEYLHRFRLTGDDQDLFRGLAAAERSLVSVKGEENSGGLAARARARFALHGFAAARDDALRLVEQEGDKRYPLEILGDALLELGDYDAAADAYAKMAAFDDGDPDAASESRLARLAIVKGDLAGARKHFDSAVALAQVMLPPSPETLAWCLVQSGQLAFQTGDWPAADRQYAAALEAHPDDWPAIDHVAELRAARKRYPEAIDLYERLIARVPRPELMQNLGDVCAVAGRADDAKRWHHAALQKYLQAVAEGGAHYDHHLAGYYCDSEPNPAEAVRWTKKDMEIRHSVYAWDGLAWALYQSGDMKGAASAMDKALALGTRDSHLLYHASLIYYRAGDAAKGKDCLRKAGEVNPKFNEFHVHR